METLVLIGVAVVVVLAFVVYLVHRYSSQSVSLAGTLVADEQKVAADIKSWLADVEGWFHKSNTAPVVVVANTVVANTVVANTVVANTVTPSK